MPQTTFDIQFRTNVTGEQEMIQKFSAAAQSMAEAFQRQFDQVTGNIQSSVGRILQASGQPFPASHGGGGFVPPGAPPGVSATPPPPPSNVGFQSAAPSAFPGGVYAYSLNHDLPFSGLSEAINGRAGSRYMRDNLEMDLGSSEASILARARRAGINVGLTPEGQKQFEAQREGAKSAIETAIAEMKNLSNRIKDLSDEMEDQNISEDTAKEKQAEINRLNNDLVRMKDLTKTGLDRVNSYNELLGAGGAAQESFMASMAKAFAPLIAGIGMVGAAPGIVRNAGVGWSNFRNFGLNAMLNGDDEALFGMYRQGGSGHMGTMSLAETLLLDSVRPWRWGQIGQDAADKNAARIAADRAANPELFKAAGIGKQDALSAFYTAQQMGSIDLSDFLNSGASAGLYGYGAQGGVSKGAIQGMLRALAGAGDSANGMSVSSRRDLIDLMSKGYANAGSAAENLFEGGMSLDRATSKLRDVYSEAVAMGIDKSRLPRVLDSVAAVAAANGPGGAAYGMASAQYGLGAIASFDKNPQDLNFLMNAHEALQSGTVLGHGSYLSNAAGMMGMQQFNKYIQSKGGKGLNYDALLTLQSFEKMSPEALAAFVKSRGGGNLSGEDLLSHLMQFRTEGYEQLGASLSPEQRQMFIAQSAHAQSLDQYNLANHLVTAERGGPKHFPGKIGTGIDTHTGSVTGGAIAQTEATVAAEEAVAGIKQLGTILKSLNAELGGLIQQLHQANPSTPFDLSNIMFDSGETTHPHEHKMLKY